MNRLSPTKIFSSSSLDIGLPEILAAFNYLAPQSDYTKEKIIEMLGFRWENANFITSDHNEQLSVSLMPQIQLEDAEQENSIKEKSKLDTPSTTISLTPSNTVEIFEVVDFLELDLDDSKVLSETSIEIHFEKPLYIPLLNQKWFQGIMSLMLATQIQTRNIDFKLIEKNIAELLPITDIPCLYRSTLNRGVQVLLDTSISMQPFWRDESELIKSLYRLFGINKIQFFEFELNLDPIPQLSWNEHFPIRLQEEVPILLVTNFGATGNVGLNLIRECTELVQLIEQAKMKKCLVAVLIPAARKDYPKDIDEFIPFAYMWDNETSPQKVNKIKRK